MSAVCNDQPVACPEGLRNLPPFPRIALQILELLSDDDAKIRDLTELINTDPAFATEILGAANSALFSYQGKVTTVPQAVVRVGFSFMKSLAMTVAMRGYVRRALRQPVLRRCWVHSVATAVLVEELGSSISFDSEATYTAGLLHDIGRLGMLAAYSDRYAKLLEEAPAERVQFLAAERELFGIDHAQAGDWLAHEWQLPPRITEVIHNTHAVRLDADPVSLTWLVAAACHFSEALGFGAVQSQSRLTDSQALEMLPPTLRPRASRDVAGLRNYVVSRINVFA